mmetsp:Transcript_69484/g.157693  ORF Transcript_69484/g.157693 Transcript_69484/m.157693 type:complete len:218 (+) Transcript_69484:663-1316(+)
MTKFLKSTVFSFSVLIMFFMCDQAKFTGFGRRGSSMITSTNSLIRRAIVLISSMKKLSARMAAERGFSFTFSVRTSCHFDARFFVASSRACFSPLRRSISSGVNFPSVAARQLLMRRFPMQRTSSMRLVFTSPITVLWLASKPSRSTQICSTASRRSRSLSMVRWSVMRRRTTPAEPQSKNSHQPAASESDSSDMSMRFLSSCEFQTLIFRVFSEPQ